MMKNKRLMIPAALIMLAFSGVLTAQTSQNMTLLGNWGMGGGEIRAVSNFGDLVYYGLGNVLAIVSFEDPANPYEAGQVILDDMVEDIVWTTIDGATYCIVSGTSLNIVNVTNPISPTLVSTMALAGYGEGVAVSGTYAYVAAGGAGMEVIDISDPANPSSVATLAGAGSGYAEGINVTDPYAYLANGANLSIMDISTPAAPTLVSSYENSGGDWIQDAKSISNYVYVAVWGTGIDVLNVSNIAEPALVTTFANSKNADVMFDGNYGYIASREFGLTVMDVSTPSAPTLISSFVTDGTLRKVSFGAINVGGALKGHIFTAEVSAIAAVDVSNAAGGMSYSGKVEVLEPAEGIAYNSFIANDKAYVAYGDYGIRILDVANPSRITELGSLTTAATTRKIVVKDDIMFVAARAGGVWVVDATDPSAPDSLTKLVDGTVNDVAISGNTVYAAARDLGVAVIDVTTANAPVLSSTIPAHYGEGIAADGSKMAQSTWDKVFFFDITDPLSPVAGDSIALSTGTGELCVSGNHAFIHDYDTLRIYDITDIQNVQFISKAFTGGSWDGSASVDGDYVYANAETAGLRVFDISDVSSPVEIAYYDGINSARGVFAKDGLAYVSEKEGGFAIYRNEVALSISNGQGIAASFRLAQNFPNPFNPVTRIDYTVPAGINDVTLEVFNTNGQLVRTLVSNAMGEGSYSVTWDSRYDNGTLAPNGIYLYRLNIGETSLSRKMILLK